MQMAEAPRSLFGASAAHVFEVFLPRSETWMKRDQVLPICRGGLARVPLQFNHVRF